MPTLMILLRERFDTASWLPLLTPALSFRYAAILPPAVVAMPGAYDYYAADA